MATGNPVTELLLRWEELREQGRDVDADELCHDCPALLATVQRRIDALRSMYAVLEGQQPSADAVSLGPSAGELQGSPAALPEVPGYELLEKLGEGGMGVVYKAVQLRPRRPVALKMLKGDAFPDDEERRRFLAEAEAIAHLQHSNIVQIYEVGEHQGRPFFSLELSREAACTSGWRADRCRPGKQRPSWSRWRGRCRRRMSGTSSTAT